MPAKVLRLLCRRWPSLGGGRRLARSLSYLGPWARRPPSPQPGTQHENLRFVSSSNSSDQHVVRSSYPDLEVPNVPLHEFVFQNLDRWETKTALECGATNRTMTYRNVYRTSRAVANSLVNKFKLAKGDHVAIILPNCPEYVTILLGCSMAGVIPTTMNSTYTSVEMVHQLKDTRSKLVFTVPETHETCTKALDAIKSQIPVVVVKTQAGSGTPTGTVAFDEVADPSQSKHFKAAVPDANDIAVVPYSSGTSGLPKGVQLTHRNLVANLLQYRLVNELKSNPNKDTNQCMVLGVLPMFHIYGMVVVTLDVVSEGSHLVSLPKFDPKTFVDTIWKKKIQIAYLVPPLVFFLGNSPMVEPKHLESVQHVVVGASPCGGTDIERLMEKSKKLDVSQGYGMTETSPIIAASHKDRFHKVSSVGHPLPSTWVKVVDLNTGKSLPQNEYGEIRVKGPQVMKGYLNRPEETENSFDSDGWLRTGDSGYYDSEYDFFIMDRVKELIKVKGYQVAPAELEELIRSHPKVADVGVIGVQHPVHGEVPKAFVVVKEKVDCTEDDIKNFVKENLSAYKQLHGGVEFVGEIPKSASGKILRKNLKKMNDDKK